MTAARHLDTVVDRVERAAMAIESGITPAQLSQAIGETCRLIGRVEGLLAAMSAAAKAWDPSTLRHDHDGDPGQTLSAALAGLAETRALVSAATFRLTHDAHPHVAHLGLRS
jgi:hypothetical protein